MADNDTHSNLSFYGFGPENVVFRGEMAHMSDAASQLSDLSISEVSTSKLFTDYFAKVVEETDRCTGHKGNNIFPTSLATIKSLLCVLFLVKPGCSSVMLVFYA